SILVPVIFRASANMSAELFMTHPDSKIIQTGVLLIFSAVIVIRDRSLFFDRPASAFELRHGACHQSSGAAPILPGALEAQRLRSWSRLSAGVGPAMSTSVFGLHCNVLGDVVMLIISCRLHAWRRFYPAVLPEQRSQSVQVRMTRWG